MTELSQFLIVFDHQQAAPHQDIAVFADAADALRAYDAAVRRTHANYFDGTAALERLLPAG